MSMTSAALVAHSIALINRFQSPTGAYPASPTFSAYAGYSWLRDGAFIAEGVSRHGQVEQAEAFHLWSARVIADRAGQVDALIARGGRGESISPGEMLPTRFTLDGVEGEDDWWDFQLDGYGTWLWSLAEHTLRYGAAVAGTEKGARVAARYLTAFWELPCYDWWEEHVDQHHVATLGAIHAGLRAALHLAVLDQREARDAETAIAAISTLVTTQGTATTSRGAALAPSPGTAPSAASASRGVAASGGYLTKWLGTDAVDASVLACVEPFGLHPAGTPVGAATVAEIERQLAVGGGVYRYLDDTFYGGGRWVLLAGFLGWNHARAGRREDATRYLEWMAAQAAELGDLPEQVSDRLLAPGRYDEWVERWGTVASPLLWSHGMFLILADELGVHAPHHPKEDS